MYRLEDNGGPQLVKALSKNHSDEEKSQRLKHRKENPFLKIIQEMNDDKPDEDKHVGQAQTMPQPHTEIQSENSKNLTTLPGAEKRKLSPDLDSPNVKKLKITPSDSKTQPPLEKSCKADSGNNDEGLKSVLVFVRSKPSRKSVSWKTETDLVEVSYFEHDPTERVNVNRTFKAMKMKEREIERRNFLAARKLSADNMEPKTAWRSLDDSLLIDIPETGIDKIEPGNRSYEKKKQNIREQSVLEASYNTRNMIPDSPDEPDEMELFPYYEPLNIPLEDISGETLSLYNYVNIPWPKPKSELEEIMQQQQIPVDCRNGMNCFMPPDSMMEMTQNQQLLPPSQHYIHEDQCMSQPVYPLHHVQHWDQQKLLIDNRLPHLKRGGGGGGYVHTKWENYSRGVVSDPYRGRMNCSYQRGNRGSPYNCRDGHSGYSRGNVLCKFYAKLGYCKNPNCAFLHIKD